MKKISLGVALLTLALVTMSFATLEGNSNEDSLNFKLIECDTIGFAPVFNENGTSSLLSETQRCCIIVFGYETICWNKTVQHEAGE